VGDAPQRDHARHKEIFPPARHAGTRVRFEVRFAMKALSLTQPWATLVCLGVKTIETRSWKTPYRGPLAIHASKSYPKNCRELEKREPFYSALRPHGQYSYPALCVGCIIGAVELVDCIPAEEAVRRGAPLQEHTFGDFSDGRFAWMLTSPRFLPAAIPVKGALGLWEFPL
jgi:hypothetical protein